MDEVIAVDLFLLWSEEMEEALLSDVLDSSTLGARAGGRDGRLFQRVVHSFLPQNAAPKFVQKNEHAKVVEHRKNNRQSYTPFSLHNFRSVVTEGTFVLDNETHPVEFR